MNTFLKDNSGCRKVNKSVDLFCCCFFVFFFSESFYYLINLYAPCSPHTPVHIVNGNSKAHRFLFFTLFSFNVVLFRCCSSWTLFFLDVVIFGRCSFWRCYSIKRTKMSTRMTTKVLRFLTTDIHFWQLFFNVILFRHVLFSTLFFSMLSFFETVKKIKSIYMIRAR